MFYFTPLNAVLFTFPSRYLFSIGRQSVFSLTGWSRQIRTGFLVPHTTWDTAWVDTYFRLPGYHRLWPAFPDLFNYYYLILFCSPATPPWLDSKWFGLFPFHSPLLRESLICFIFFRVLRCFSSPTCLLISYFIQIRVVEYYSYRVAPFRYPRIKVCNDSPWHFAVCCVFLRLLAPRYSPCALSSLTNFLYNYACFT